MSLADAGPSHCDAIHGFHWTADHGAFPWMSGPAATAPSHVSSFSLESRRRWVVPALASGCCWARIFGGALSRDSQTKPQEETLQTCLAMPRAVGLLCGPRQRPSVPARLLHRDNLEKVAHTADHRRPTRAAAAQERALKSLPTVPGPTTRRQWSRRNMRGCCSHI